MAALISVTQRVPRSSAYLEGVGRRRPMRFEASLVAISVADNTMRQPPPPYRSASPRVGIESTPWYLPRRKIESILGTLDV